jgi:mono/diheme cytochrome c family protein
MGRMTDSGNAKMFPALLKNRFALAAIAASLILLPAAAFAAEPAPSAADQACLGCHGAPGMEKKLADGDTLQLLVPLVLYAKSVHGANGCTMPTSTSPSIRPRRTTSPASAALRSP